MRVLMLSSFFPPDAQGGAEISAWNLAHWLRANGHEVGILTTAATPSQGEMVREDGLSIWRAPMPRAYSVHAHARQPWHKKLLWHVQDHLDPRNIGIAKRVLDSFAPDFVSIHLLTGLGWNILPELGRRQIPVLFVLPDLVLACMRSAMFRNHANCQAQCLDCRLSSALKMRGVRSIARLGFSSPSLANLSRLQSHVSLERWPRAVLVNPNRYPIPRVGHVPGEQVRFLFVGRLHPSKGVDLLLAAAERLIVAGKPLHLAIVGDGPLSAVLKARYSHHSEISFHGHISQQEVADRMAGSDLLCVPSVWSENSPGVAIQALAQGLPVLASDVGGIPELLGDAGQGFLIVPGDSSRWEAAMAAIIDNPATLVAARQRALQRGKEFDPDRAGAAIWQFMQEIAGAPPPRV
jgi:glycosyltransferase involved in cell wall biosynthesis